MTAILVGLYGVIPICKLNKNQNLYLRFIPLIPEIIKPV